MELRAENYQLVSSGFSMLLFQRYFADSKVLTSPGWAYDELKASCVMDGADRFTDEMNEWIKGVNLNWSETFWNRMDAKYKDRDVCISDIIFGEEFTKKDFENWCVRIREKLKRKITEDTYDRMMLDL